MKNFGVETCVAKVISADTTNAGRTNLVLDQTCFYARGGGQDWDMGTITRSGARFNVEEVRLDESGEIHHLGKITGGTFSNEDEVDCEVDHARRAINMRLHSAAHIIDMAVADLGLDWIGTKGQHYPHLSGVEYSGTWDPATSKELRTELEALTNNYVEQGSTNSIRFMPISEMHTICRHVPDNIPANKPGRVVIYGKNFGVPCGGTHVKNIHEVGRITIPSLKMKRGVIRLSYSVEGISSNS